MLAAINDYTHIWQLPLLLIGVVGWLVWGGMLFRNSARRVTGQSRIGLGRGVGIAGASGFCGTLGGAIVAYIVVNALKNSAGIMVSTLIGGAAGLAMYLLLTYLVVYTMHGTLHAKEVLTLCIKPLAIIVSLNIVVGLLCIVPAYIQRQGEIEQLQLQRDVQQRMCDVYDVLRRNAINPPKTLQELVDAKKIEQKMIQMSGDNPKTFFYNSLRIPSSPNVILLCTYKDDIEGGRMVLLSSGKCSFIQKNGFSELLKREENKEFAEALKKAEGK